jgi:hypothetical protein
LLPLRAGAVGYLLKHPLSAEVLLGRQRVVRPAAQREIVDGSWATAHMGRDMMELQSRLFATALATYISIGATSCVPLPHDAANCRRDLLAPRWRGVFVLWRLLGGGEGGARFRVSWFGSRWASW